MDARSIRIHPCVDTPTMETSMQLLCAVLVAAARTMCCACGGGQIVTTTTTTTTTTALIGDGFCTGSHIYASSAWTLATSSGGIKDFDTAEYKAWISDAWQRCWGRDAETRFVSVWTDAGYRCYKGSTCTTTDHNNVRSWKFKACANTNGDEEDAYGRGCGIFSAFPSSCEMYDTQTFNAKAMCCACGGGQEV
eukprot:TRINITY_DN10812_c0_g1_i1.p1 TRINITY_DN10812_c0_g1~~TRINITY_DN10812_c0_g1_i1.p1  ORF type:complete len:193 (-),score=28.47 TRINITY_DN10812_c0_g1_i1:127-705(-)